MKIMTKNDFFILSKILGYGIVLSLLAFSLLVYFSYYGLIIGNVIDFLF